MINCNSLIEYFGTELSNILFQGFLKSNFSDLTQYDILKSEYICSNKKGIELGFINNTAVFDDDAQKIFEKGIPVFSHFNLKSQSSKYVTNLPLNANITDTRDQILQKAGAPTKSREGYLDLINKNFRIDNYQVSDIVISFDYNHETDQLNNIQIRSYKLTTPSI